MIVIEIVKKPPLSENFVRLVLHVSEHENVHFYFHILRLADEFLNAM